MDLVVATLEAGALVGEHQLADLERLLEAAHTLPDGRELEAVAHVLHVVPGGPQAQHRAALGDRVERRDRFGQQCRVAVGDA